MSDGSSAGGSYVGGRGIVFMAIYLVLLCLFLLYLLVALWPSSLPLSIASVEPNVSSSGKAVRISGTGFEPGVQISFGDARAPKVVRESDSLVEATTPEHAEGSVSVEARTPNGHVALLPNGFKFQAPSTANVPSPPVPSPSPSSTPQKPAASPSAGNAPSTRSPAETEATTNHAPVRKRFWFSFAVSENVRLLLIVIVVGALGSLIHVLRSFYWYVGNRNLRVSWLLMYVLLPFTGAGLALLFFLIVKGGLSSQTVPTQTTLDGYAALSALVGMFSQQALQKLKQVAESIFNPAEKGKDQAVTAGPLKLSAVQPTRGSKAGGTAVHLTGSGFSTVNRITFGGAQASKFSITSDAQMDAVTPGHASGTVDVEVTNAAGQKSSLPSSFTFSDLRVASIAPTNGPKAGGTQAKISGDGFKSGASAKIGGTPVSSLTVTNESTLDVMTPAGKPGPADVEVSNADGSTAVLAGGFTFN